MTIWTVPSPVISANERSKNTMVTHLGIEFLTCGEDFLTAKMPVDERTKQPIGIMHGGASCVLAETVGSVAANYCVDTTRQYCVGLDINTNHLRSVSSGDVFACAKPLHIGQSTQVWGIEIRDEKNRLISVSRLTLMVLSRK